MLSWTEWRQRLASELRSLEPTTDHVQQAIELIDEIDYEGAEIAGLHDVYEYAYLAECEDGYVINEWDDFHLDDAVYDWLINSHPGLCPYDVVADIKRMWDR